MGAVLELFSVQSSLLTARPEVLESPPFLTVLIFGCSIMSQVRYLDDLRYVDSINSNFKKTELQCLRRSSFPFVLGRCV